MDDAYTKCVARCLNNDVAAFEKDYMRQLLQ